MDAKSHIRLPPFLVALSAAPAGCERAQLALKTHPHCSYWKLMGVAALLVERPSNSTPARYSSHVHSSAPVSQLLRYATYCGAKAMIGWLDFPAPPGIVAYQLGMAHMIMEGMLLPGSCLVSGPTDPACKAFI